MENNMESFPIKQPSEGWDKFVDQVVKPTPHEMTRFGEDVEQFAKFLRENFSYKKCSIAKVVKNGSLGKGTATKDSDIDLVVYINDISSIRSLIQMRPHLLKVIQDQVIAYNDWKGRVTLKQVTRFSVKYTLQKDHGSHAETHEVDILPAFDILKQVGESPSGVYAKITGGAHLQDLSRKVRRKRSRNGRQISASLAPLQIGFMDDFFRKIPDSHQQDVRNAIRLLKYWRKTTPLASTKPSQKQLMHIRSYSLELLTVHVYETTGIQSTAGLFHAVLTLLAKGGRLCVAFNKNYHADTYTRFLAPSYILDPANPFMDTLTGVHLKAVRRAARDTLRKLA